MVVFTGGAFVLSFLFTFFLLHHAIKKEKKRVFGSAQNGRRMMHFRLQTKKIIKPDRLARSVSGFIGFYWVLLGFTGFYWVLLGFTGFY